jgi:hypothetical protein
MQLMCGTVQTKSSFYQMILLDGSNTIATRDSLKRNNLKCIPLTTSRTSNNFVIVEAPQNLGYILKDIKNIILFNYSNEDFLLLIETVKSIGYNIENFDLLGSQFFSEELSENLERCSCLNDILGYIKLIKQNQIEITKFKATNGNKKIAFYRSGLIYTNFDVSEIKPVLISVLEKLNA